MIFERTSELHFADDLNWYLWKQKNAWSKNPTADHSLVAFKQSTFNLLKSQWHKCEGSQNVCSFETFLWSSSTDDQDHLGLHVFWLKAIVRLYIAAFTWGGKTDYLIWMSPIFTAAQ